MVVFVLLVLSHENSARAQSGIPDSGAISHDDVRNAMAFLFGPGADMNR
jgi:hypothetical protein